MNFKFWNNITGWLVFAMTMTVYYFSVESTGSLWDCGEFIAGAYKLQVVHPPGAVVFADRKNIYHVRRAFFLCSGGDCSISESDVGCLHCSGGNFFVLDNCYSC